MAGDPVIRISPWCALFDSSSGWLCSSCPAFCSYDSADLHSDSENLFTMEHRTKIAFLDFAGRGRICHRSNGSRLQENIHQCDVENSRWSESVLAITSRLSMDPEFDRNSPRLRFNSDLGFHCLRFVFSALSTSSSGRSICYIMLANCNLIRGGHSHENIY